MKGKLTLLVPLLFGFLLHTFPSEALELLPYSVRTHPYNAWSVSPRGDLRTVGMSGATVGLADTFIAAIDNPAGLAMTLNTANTHFSTDMAFDGFIQSQDNSVLTRNFGIGFPLYPWGFSLGYVDTNYESQTYATASAPNDPIDLYINTQVYRFSVARVFFDNRLSLGVSLNFGQGGINIRYSNVPLFTSGSPALFGTLGGMYQLHQHFLLGLSIHSPAHYLANAPTTATPGLTGFYQDLYLPLRVGIGMGWIPNRFFRADFTTFFVGKNIATALLRDDQTAIGHTITVQPRLGVAYHWLDFKELQATGYAGAYYEMSRIQGTPDRLHGTVGLELRPWIFHLGWALDASNSYRNHVVSLGIDVLRTMQKLDLVPIHRQFNHKGFFPNPSVISDAELARPLVKHWKPTAPEPSPLEVGLAIPGKLEVKALELSQTLEHTFAKKTAPKKKKAPQKPKKKAKHKLH